MNQRYFATFVSGAQEIIVNRLRRFTRAELSLDEIQDGVVLFTASLPANKLAELRFFNNVFGLLGEYKGIGNVEQAAELAAQADLNALPPKSGFKIYARKESQTIALRSLAMLQRSVADVTGGIPDSFRPDVELLLWLRDDSRALWGWRLPRPGFKTRALEAGELRPQVAHIMGLLAGLDHKDVVLDPFAGYGAIVRECLQGFHCQQVVGVESNEHLVPHLKSISHLVAMHGDATRLPHIDTRSIDRVITDPPWGKFEAAAPARLEHLYYEALTQMRRVLRVRGCAVILTGVDFLPKVAQQVGFVVEKQYGLLVGGQKAGLFKLRKAGRT